MTLPDHGSVYDGLLGGDESQWAFGSGPDAPSAGDPLAGMDLGVPDGVDPTALARYSLMLGDDALVLSHRLSEWCSNAPDLEEDVALANIALDLLGQARLLLTRAAAADPALVPALAPGLPAGSPVPAEDALAFFRDERDFGNLRLVERPNGDFAETIARLLLFSVHRLELFTRLRTSRDAVLAAIAATGVPELAYHRDHAARWFRTLAQGTPESRRRLLAGLAQVLPFVEEMYLPHPVEQELAAADVGVDPAELRVDVGAVLDQVCEASAIELPEFRSVGPVAGGRGRHGRHTEALGRMLAEMQVVARAHPMGRW